MQKEIASSLPENTNTRMVSSPVNAGKRCARSCDGSWRRPAVLGISFTALSVRLLSLRAALLALLPLFVAVVFGNALTHIFWLCYFQTYAPGVLTSALLLVPLTLYLIRGVLQERLVSSTYVWSLLGLALLQPVAAAAAGGTLSGPQLAFQRLGARFAGWLWGAV